MNKRFIRFALILLCLLSPFVYARGEDALWQPDLPATMPVVSITTANGSNEFIEAYSREHKLMGMIQYVDGYVTVSCEGEEVLRNAKAQLKARGNYTLDYPKKSIRIKFEKKQSMLAMNEGAAYRNWVLLAEWKDLSLMHSAAGLYLAQNILGADGYYCSDYRFVRVHVNGDDRGVYLLAEQQEVNPGRVDIAEPGPDSASPLTGYLLEYDAYYLEEAALPNADPAFAIDHHALSGEQYGYTIKSSIPDRSHIAFIQNCLKLIYQACYSAMEFDVHAAFSEDCTALVTLPRQTVQETIGGLIDLPSLVDTYILQEIICNPDLGWSSFYMSLDLSAAGSKKLTFHAPWDFDSAFGIRHDYESNQGMYALSAGNPWLQLIAAQPWFTDMVKARWAQLLAADLPGQTLALVARIKDMYAQDFIENYGLWPGRITDGNHELIDELNSCTSQSQAADYLYRWLEGRFTFLNAQWE